VADEPQPESDDRNGAGSGASKDRRDVSRTFAAMGDLERAAASTIAEMNRDTPALWQNNATVYEITIPGRVSQLRRLAREHRVQRVRDIIGREEVDRAPGDDAVGAHEDAAVGRDAVGAAEAVGLDDVLVDPGE